MNEKRSSLERLLSDLSRDQLQSLLLKLAEHNPSLTTVIEGRVALFRPATSLHHPPIDPKAIRHRGTTPHLRTARTVPGVFVSD